MVNESHFQLSGADVCSLYIISNARFLIFFITIMLLKRLLFLSYVFHYRMKSSEVVITGVVIVIILIIANIAVVIYVFIVIRLFVIGLKSSFSLVLSFSSEACLGLTHFIEFCIVLIISIIFEDFILLIL